VLTMTPTFFFGFLAGMSAMLVLTQWMLSSIKRDIQRIRELREMERKIERKA